MYVRPRPGARMLTIVPRSKSFRSGPCHAPLIFCVFPRRCTVLVCRLIASHMPSISGVWHGVLRVVPLTCRPHAARLRLMCPRPKSAVAGLRRVWPTSGRAWSNAGQIWLAKLAERAYSQPGTRTSSRRGDQPCNGRVAGKGGCTARAQGRGARRRTHHTRRRTRNGPTADRMAPRLALDSQGGGGA